jgi:2-iminobutanoate/2-iminopropanoate deaminase
MGLVGARNSWGSPVSRRTFHFWRESEQAFGYAQAVSAGGLLFVSGTLSVDASFQTIAAGDMRQQLEAVYSALRETLAAHDSGFYAVVKETVFVTDMEAFLAANDVRVAIYQGLALPAVTAVEVRRLAFPDNVVEIEIVATLEAVA